MAFDYKREYKELYLPGDRPGIIVVPPMNFVAVHGQGDPNEEDGEYAHAINLLYGISYTIKMSRKGAHRIEGYFDYVVPPLEGFWWQDGVEGVDLSRKDGFKWISAIRLPDFVTRSEFEWAVGEASARKKMDFSSAEFITLDEGLSVQCLHIGPYDAEPATVQSMHAHMEQRGYKLDFTETRHHHEIYLGDPRRMAPEKLKTVLRHPIRPA